ncbi:MAG: dihydroorotate dehydrogenase [Candidatus Thermoplasmatota archaeon]|nr:dihydroorotate dehydrogenase [Candidatus Thermoplasmatota archaeon]
MSHLNVKAGGISLKEPGILASGILDENGYSMKRILLEGAGAAVTKSIGIDGRDGYNPPVVVETGSGILNAMGLPNPGIDNFSDEINLAMKAGKPVIGSIFASNANDFLKLAEKMSDYGVAAVELNLSCPHVKGFGTEVGSDPALVKEIVSTLKGSISIPVWAKLSPNVTDILSIANAASDSDAVVLINTVRGMAIDIYARSPILTNRYGGLSGSSIKPVGLRLVYEVRKELGLEIIGVGGISTWQDALEYIMAGSSAFQVGTALWSNGRKVFSEINQGLESYMKEFGVGNLMELRGVAIR